MNTTPTPAIGEGNKLVHIWDGPDLKMTLLVNLGMPVNANDYVYSETWGLAKVMRKFDYGYECMLPSGQSLKLDNALKVIASSVKLKNMEATL